MMLDIIMLALVVVSAFQPTREREYAAFLFTGFAVCHYVLMYDVDGWLYYFSAAALDAAVVFFTLRLKIISPVIESIHSICYISIMMNFFGWLLWQLYLPPDAYNSAFLLIYAWAIMNLLRRETGDAGGISAIGVGRRHILATVGKGYNSNTRKANEK